MKGRRLGILHDIKAETHRIFNADRNVLTGRISKLEETDIVVCMWEGFASRLTTIDMPYFKLENYTASVQKYLLNFYANINNTQ
jgi:hypothetical protein